MVNGTLGPAGGGGAVGGEPPGRHGASRGASRGSACRPLPAFARRRPVRPSTGTGAPAAAVRVLEAAGFAVRTPSTRVCCGLTFTPTGQFGAERRRGRAALGKAASAGVEVVGPGAVLR